MSDDPLEITLDGALLEKINAVAAAYGMTAEEWVIERLTLHVAKLREANSEAPE